MKNIMKLTFVFAFAFILTKLQMGSGIVYFGANEEATKEPTQAKVYETISEAYEAQNIYGADWEIKKI